MWLHINLIDIAQYRVRLRKLLTHMIDIYNHYKQSLI